MIRYLLLLGFILTLIRGFATEEISDRVDHYEASFPSKDGPTIKIKITSTKFKREGHVMGEAEATVDGKRIYGVDGPPQDGTDVIDFFEVTFGDKIVKVPAEQWRDCFNPTLRSPAINPTLPDYAQVGSLEVFISPDRKKVSIMMGGYRSASAPYRVIWIVQSDNHGTRLIEDVET